MLPIDLAVVRVTLHVLAATIWVGGQIVVKMVFVVLSGLGAALHTVAKNYALKGIGGAIGLLGALAALLLGVSLWPSRLPGAPEPAGTRAGCEDVPMTSFAGIERQGLCDTFERVGPDAPTLCSPWSTRDLAAHLVVRERRPDVVAGMWLPPLAGRLKQVQNAYASWEWPRLVEQVRSGPPPWSPASLARVDEAINTAEFFVHHEDVLRGGSAWTARELTADLESALWGIVSKVARLHFARATAGVVLVSPPYGRRQVHAMTDLGTVVVKGTPGELLLYSFGRRGVAQVDVSGPDEAINAI